MKPDKFKEETFNNEENRSLGYCFKVCTHFPMGGTWLNQVMDKTLNYLKQSVLGSATTQSDTRS